MTLSETADALRCRQRRAQLGRRGDAICSVCGTACPQTRPDRFGIKLPATCSRACSETVRHREAKR